MKVLAKDQIIAPELRRVCQEGALKLANLRDNLEGLSFCVEGQNRFQGKTEMMSLIKEYKGSLTLNPAQCSVIVIPEDFLQMPD